MRGIIFLGTPQKGSGADSIGGTIAMAAQALQLGDSNLIPDISADFIGTHDMVVDFATIMIQNDLTKTDSIVCFFENKPTDYGRRVGGLVPWKYLVECSCRRQYVLESTELDCPQDFSRISRHPPS